MCAWKQMHSNYAIQYIRVMNTALFTVKCSELYASSVSYQYTTPGTSPGSQYMNNLATKIAAVVDH